MVGLVVKHKLDFWYYFAGRLRDDNGWVREEEKLRLNYVADKRALAPGQLGIPEKKSIDSLIRLSGYELDPAVALRNDYKILLGRYSKFQEFEFGYEYKKDGRIGWWPMSDRVAAAVSNFSKNPRAKLSLCAELAGVGAKKQKK